jgi:hypothetical protein
MRATCSCIAVAGVARSYMRFSRQAADELGHQWPGSDSIQRNRRSGESQSDRLLLQ